MFVYKIILYHFVSLDYCIFVNYILSYPIVNMENENWSILIIILHIETVRENIVNIFKKNENGCCKKRISN